MDWIKAEDKMPENSEFVLGYWKNEFGFTFMELVGYENQDKCFYSENECIRDEVTHWMPLPSAPLDNQ